MAQIFKIWRLKRFWTNFDKKFKRSTTCHYWSLRIYSKKSEKQVAPDIVEIEVFGPDCVDLTLIDLPGIVRTVGKDEN